MYSMYASTSDMGSMSSTNPYAWIIMLIAMVFIIVCVAVLCVTGTVPVLLIGATAIIIVLCVRKKNAPKYVVISKTTVKATEDTETIAESVAEEEPSPTEEN